MTGHDDGARAALVACGKATKHGPHDDCVGIPLPPTADQSAASVACHPFDEPCDYGTGGPCRNHGGVVPEAARECSFCLRTARWAVEGHEHPFLAMACGRHAHAALDLALLAGNPTTEIRTAAVAGTSQAVPT